MKCYNYEPHFHPERLKQSLPNTKGDEFIWACSSGDISFGKKEWIDKILNRMRELPHKTFFIQTKDPNFFFKYDFPNNLILGITLETNRWTKDISKAPTPLAREMNFTRLKHSRKRVTIEPIMDFDLEVFVNMISLILPETVYIGYDTKKTKLPEPALEKTLELIERLRKFTIVKPKLLREKWDS